MIRTPAIQSRPLVARKLYAPSVDSRGDLKLFKTENANINGPDVFLQTEERDGDTCRIELTPAKVTRIAIFPVGFENRYLSYSGKQYLFLLLMWFGMFIVKLTEALPVVLYLSLFSLVASILPKIGWERFFFKSKKRGDDQAFDTNGTYKNIAVVYFGVCLSHNFLPLIASSSHLNLVLILLMNVFFSESTFWFLSIAKRKRRFLAWMAFCFIWSVSIVAYLAFHMSGNGVIMAVLLVFEIIGVFFALWFIYRVSCLKERD